MCTSCRSRQELSNEYLVFICKKSASVQPRTSLSKWGGRVLDIRNAKLEPIYSHQGFDPPPPTEANGDPPGAIGAPPMEGEAPRGVFPVPMAARALCVAPSSTSSRFSERQLQTAPSQLYQNEIQQKESAFSNSVLQL